MSFAFFFGLALPGLQHLHFPARARTRVPGSGSAESEPLECQRNSPLSVLHRGLGSTVCFSSMMEGETEVLTSFEKGLGCDEERAREPHLLARLQPGDRITHQAAWGWRLGLVTQSMSAPSCVFPKQRGHLRRREKNRRGPRMGKSGEGNN